MKTLFYLTITIITIVAFNAYAECGTDIVVTNEEAEITWKTIRHYGGICEWPDMVYSNDNVYITYYRRNPTWCKLMKNDEVYWQCENIGDLLDWSVTQAKADNTERTHKIDVYFDDPLLTHEFQIYIDMNRAIPAKYRDYPPEFEGNENYLKVEYKSNAFKAIKISKIIIKVLVKSLLTKKPF